MVPIAVLNTFGGVAGGIWLAIRGEWKLIGIGLLLVLISQWILAILMAPGLLIAVAGSYFDRKRSFLRDVFGFMAQFYTNLLIVGSCVFAVWLCSSYYPHEKTGIDFLPYLLWA